MANIIDGKIRYTFPVSMTAILGLMLFFLFSCSESANPGKTTQNTPVKPSGSLALSAQEQEWERTIEDLQSYRDLLNPRWKGKIVWSDPSIGGSGNMWFSTIGLRVMGQSYLKELAKQDIVFTRDLRLMGEWMARGKYPVGIGAGGSLVEMQKAGVPLQSFTPKEGSYLTSGWGNIAIYKKAPHPNAARLFINWFLSKEGQTVYSKGMDAQSARIDVPEYNSKVKSQNHNSRLQTPDSRL